MITTDEMYKEAPDMFDLAMASSKLIYGKKCKLGDNITGIVIGYGVTLYPDRSIHSGPRFLVKLDNPPSLGSMQFSVVSVHPASIDWDSIDNL